MIATEINSGPARLRIDPQDGGRWTGLTVHGHELLSGAPAQGVPRGVTHGCFVMAPFAGRLGWGRIGSHQLPVNAPPHAIHGTVFARPWAVIDLAEDRLVLGCELGPEWPYAGSVRQEVLLGADGLEATLVLEAARAMPVTLGFHPWFARRLGSGSPARLHVAARSRYARGVDGLPTGELVDPGPGPWDDCFTGLSTPPRIEWPGALSLTLTSSHDHWVVFDERPEAVCVEPQTGPPDAVRLGLAELVPDGGTTSLRLRLAWSRLD